MRVVEYILLNESPEHIQRVVNAMIVNGYQPLGAPTVILMGADGYAKYAKVYQAMTKSE